jgi:hypothetical protein
LKKIKKINWSKKKQNGGENQDGYQAEPEKFASVDQKP